LIKIYFNQKILFLATHIDPALELYYGQDGTAFLDKVDESAVKEFLHTVRNPDILAGILVHSDLDALLDMVKKEFTVVQAAGGLVHNDAGAFLFIYRRGKWDLPKGKLDDGEELKTCALREVAEETGVKDLEISQELMTTYHTYTENNEEILKETHWFLMTTSDNSDLQPQQEEDIEVCEWVQPDQLQDYLKNTHPSVIDVMDRGMSVLTV
jgi:8-oxo-dGTP pyrophosphatase MutT (NUDIX family)